MPAHVVIVGGGIAGLSVAYELARQHVPFTLLEARPRLGGVMLSEELDGFVIDAGPDALLVQKPEAIRLCEELGLGPRLVSTLPPREAFIQRGGELFSLPAGSVLGIPTQWGPFIRTGLFTWSGKIRMGLETCIPARTDDEDESIGEFMRRRFGSEATDYLAEPLLAGIHAGDVDRLSIRALFPRFVHTERTHGSLLRAFRRSAVPAPARPLSTTLRAAAVAAAPADDSPQAAREGGAFRSLPGGLSEITRALVATLPTNALHIGCAVLDVARLGHQYRVTTDSAATFSGDSVVLATPAFATARFVRSFDARVADACATVRYASAATVALAFPRSAVAHPLRGSGFVVPKVEGSGILAGTWLSSKWPHRAPEGYALMRAFLGGARDPDVMALSDGEMVDRALKALRPLLRITGAPLFTRVYRWDLANAQHEVGHLARVQAIERAVSAHPGLFVTGSGYRGVGIPDCIADGRATGRRVVEWMKNARVESRDVRAEI